MLSHCAFVEHAHPDNKRNIITITINGSELPFGLSGLLLKIFCASFSNRVVGGCQCWDGIQ